MKKVLLVLAVTMLAVGTQAATMSWTMTNVKKDGAAVTGKMFLCVASGDFNRDSVLALAGKGVSAFESALAGQFAWNVTNGTGTMTNTNASRPTNDALGVTGGTSYDFFAVVFNTDEITKDSYFFVTANKNVTPNDNSTTLNKAIFFGTQATASNAEGAWQAVPEPTTGLLLLIGMAGLALRRKQA